MKTNLFHISIIPIDRVLSHEEYDPSRKDPLRKRIETSGIFTNPIIVTPMRSGKYLQLDGMNRLSAMKAMNIPVIPAQIIDYNDQETVELSSWVHLSRTDKEAFLSFIRNDCNCDVHEGSYEHTGHRYVKDEDMERICTLVFGSKDVYLVSANGGLLDKISTLSSIVRYYKKGITRDVLPTKTNVASVDALFSRHKDANCLVIFPTFTRHQIFEVVKKGGVFPSGVTRHIIARRCLNLNIPLSFLKSGKTVAKLNNELNDMLAKRQIRFYEEPTVYFE